MPAGPGIGGFFYFVGIKAAGYSAAALFIKDLYSPDAPKPTVVSVGLTRTAIGIGAGVAYGGLWMLLGDKLQLSDTVSGFLFFGLLIPIRFVEWGALVKIYFDPNLSLRKQLWKVLIGGTIWSYCLDGIGVLAAFVLPGGMWVC